MEWTAQGIICAVSRHGESGAVLRVLTAEHGLYAGFVPGGMGKRNRAILQPGNDVTLRWRARLADQLGTMIVEPVKARAAGAMASPVRLAGLASLTSLMVTALPERESMPDVYGALQVALDLLCDDGVPLEVAAAGVIRFEMGLLGQLGFALDLSRCAGTGSQDNLIYVSPKTGRAVSADAGAPYEDRLLRLPAFLLGSQAGHAQPSALSQGFALTGYFLSKWVAEPKNADLPNARERFIHLALKAVESAP